MRPALPSPMAAPGDLAMRVKAYQKQGEREKNAWHTFCDAHLGGIRDPSRHDAATLQRFLATHQAQGGGGAYVASAQNPLVMKVKSYQRQGAAEKDNWHHYADSNCGGVRDPSRLDASSLQTFIATYGL